MGVLKELSDRIVPSKWTYKGGVEAAEGITVSNGREAEGHSEITFDYLRAEGGIPFIETSQISSDGGPIEIEMVFSETFSGLDRPTGTGYSQNLSDLC